MIAHPTEFEVTHGKVSTYRMDYKDSRDCRSYAEEKDYARKTLEGWLYEVIDKLATGVSGGKWITRGKDNIRIVVEYDFKKSRGGKNAKRE